jgi:outer membrane protein OmpA-like peptidoglycan-associated protein
MRFRTSLLAATFLAAAAALPLAARAQPVTGLYIGAGAGGNILQNESSKTSVNLGTTKLKDTFDFGALGVASVGYGLGNGVRVELEGDYRYNQVNKLEGTPYPAIGKGYQETYGAMVNALYDLDIGQNWIYPYLGVGAGWGQLKWHGVTAVNPSLGNSFFSNGQTSSLAYQGIIGASFPLAFMPGLSATAEYRFYGLANPGSLKSEVITPTGTTYGKSGINQDLNNSFLIGIRYAFNAAPPPPPPAPAPVAAPAPAPARTYLVFFDWDRADLTARARQIIQEAAQNSTRVQVTRIDVNGYTDLSGTAAYNQRLSVRRAQAVQAELIRDGVQPSIISIHGYGESNPLVPTAQGVREPQNRRVEIILH